MGIVAVQGSWRVPEGDEVEREDQLEFDESLGMRHLGDDDVELAAF